MRHRLAQNPPLGVLGFRRAAPAEPGEGQIEGTPEEMHRTCLPEESTFEPCQGAVGVQQHVKESLSELGIVRSVATIVQERDRRVDLNGYRPYLHGNSQGLEHAHVFSIKVRYRLRSQRDAARCAVARVHDQPMVDEIELDVEGARSVRDRRRDQSARADVQRHVPPVILRRCQGKSRFPDDLHPHVQGVVRVPPFRELQARPDCAHAVSHSAMAW